MKPHHGDPDQALVWGGCGRQRSLARYKANPTSFLYQANFPGLGRGLRGLKQALDRLRTVARISSVIRAPTKGFSRR